VAVFSGNNVVSNGLLPSAGHIVEQLPSVDNWGSTFYLLALPGVQEYTYMVNENLIFVNVREYSLIGYFNRRM